MLMKRTLAFACFAGWLLLASPAFAQICTGNQDCDNGLRCYNQSGVKWCGITYSGSTHWTQVNVYNHTRFSEVNTAWSNWNNPPNGPPNTPAAGVGRHQQFVP